MKELIDVSDELFNLAQRICQCNENRELTRSEVVVMALESLVEKAICNIAVAEERMAIKNGMSREEKIECLLNSLLGIKEDLNGNERPFQQAIKTLNNYGKFIEWNEQKTE
ncbi:hypothetical protein [Beggiatoa leptomitoformis]|uniref:Uncharacterized protein n=1 Tax=Beggiatoa leptomitoformis TaxID=288004 RepID=A0A2N9YH07_9GAMM|nr:hypothetical protein [Beggiatoa leptomitoformis]ALG67894.1 hypothetical protein AL038_09450 [Beggiatoa leptomitoformis]AUI69841.1 hypothetical protein BLE401_14840 [Beggiatoa leptomitoformis]